MKNLTNTKGVGDTIKSKDSLTLLVGVLSAGITLKDSFSLFLKVKHDVALTMTLLEIYPTDISSLFTKNTYNNAHRTFTHNNFLVMVFMVFTINNPSVHK